jgi:hypothetical protein
MKMPVCALRSCNRLGTLNCSACRREFYCSVECQKKDWKVHKQMCNSVKMMSDLMSNTQLLFKDACSVLNKLKKEMKEKLESKIGSMNLFKLIERAVVYTQNQFGKRMEGKEFYERDNGDSVGAWYVEIDILSYFYNALGDKVSSPDNG